MKKLLILLFCIFLTSGCYDYVELNNLAIISGISIDKKDNEYIVIYEILNTVNKEENPNEEKVYFTKGKGNTISEAFLNVSYEVPKNSYAAHVDTIVISEEIAQNDLKDIIDYLIRDIDIRNQFYLVIAHNSSAEEIIKTTSTTNPISSSSIKDLIEQISKKKNIASTLNYEKFLAHILGPQKDGYLTTISKNNNNLEIGPIAIFDDFNMQTILTAEEATNFNLLNNSSYESTFKITCPENKEEKMVLVTSIPASTEIEFTPDKATFNINLEVRVVENHCDVDFRNIEDLNTIEKILSEKIKTEITELLDKLTFYNSDVLEISHKYYQKYRQDIDFTTLEYDSKIKALINRNGLIFEVNE